MRFVESLSSSTSHQLPSSASRWSPPLSSSLHMNGLVLFWQWVLSRLQLPFCPQLPSAVPDPAGLAYLFTGSSASSLPLPPFFDNFSSRFCQGLPFGQGPALLARVCPLVKGLPFCQGLRVPFSRVVFQPKLEQKNTGTQTLFQAAQQAPRWLC